MKTARDALVRLIGQMPEAEVRRPRTIDRWAVKDVLGHLVACDEETIRRFRQIERGQADRIHWFESMADADRFNARTVAQKRRLGVAALLRRMERVGADVVDAFERLPAERLDDPSHAYPVTEWLPAPGWSHVEDHLDEVKRWWRVAERASGGASRGGTRPRRRRT
jgi:hypothetical protein